MRADSTTSYLSSSLVLLVTFLLAGALWFDPASAAADEVECDSIRLSMPGKDYDMTCEDGGGLDYTYQSLEANSNNGSHFLVIADFVTNNNYVFNGEGLRASLTDIFEALEVKDWSTGKLEQGLTISEFTSDYKTVPSACVAFQKYVHKSQWGGGYKRHVIGFGCSREGNRQEVYDAIKLVEFP